MRGRGPIRRARHSARRSPRLVLRARLAGWASRGHPDPTGSLLQSLVPALRAMVRSCREGVDPRNPRYGKPFRWGVVWDFMSFPQRGYTSGYDPDRDDRTPYQLARFGGGLKGINVWSASQRGRAALV